MSAQVYWFVGLMPIFVAISVVFKTKTANESRKEKLIEGKTASEAPP